MKPKIHIASCSFSKDSIATILLALENNEPSTGWCFGADEKPEQSPRIIIKEVNMKTNELKCTDLRIGNWIKYEDKLVQVVQLSSL